MKNENDDHSARILEPPATSDQATPHPSSKPGRTVQTTLTPFTPCCENNSNPPTEDAADRTPSSRSTEGGAGDGRFHGPLFALRPGPSILADRIERAQAAAVLAKRRSRKPRGAQDPAASIILATFNERENIQDTIRGIFANLPENTEIIVVDDDSPDETWRLAEQVSDPRVTVIRRVSTRGLASAFNRGILESRGTVVGWMDADMSMPPTLLPRMIAQLDLHDVVIASRYAPGGSDNRSRLRVWSSRCINRFASLILGGGIGDYDSGFVVLRREVFDKVSVIPTGYGAYFMEFLYACRKKGLSVVETPYAFHDRAKGVSKSAPNLWRFCRTGMGYVLRILIARIRRID